MNKVDILKFLAVAFFLFILFTPMESNLRVPFLFLGITFGVFWFVKS
jgi:hypothetical protein